MKSTYTITEAQAELPGLVRKADDGGAIAITRHGATVAYVVSKMTPEPPKEVQDLVASLRYPGKDAPPPSAAH